MSDSAFITVDLEQQVICQTDEAVSVRVIRDLEDIRAMRTSWGAMQRHPNVDIDFYEDVLHAWSARCRPYILVISRYGSPEAMLVGRVETVYIEHRLGYKTLARTRARQLTFIYGGMLGNFSPQNCLVVLESIRASLREREADLAEFHFIRTDSDLCRLLSASGGIRSFRSSEQIHRSSTVGYSAEDTYRNMSAKRRKNLRGKKLLQDFEGRISIRCFHEPDSMGKMLKDIENIASKTYHRQLGVGFDGSEELQQRMRREAERERLRAYVLYLAGEPAAFWIATAYKGVLYSDFMGYDPAHAKYSPGMYLVTKTLEGLSASDIDSNVRLVDWGLGDAQYKQVLGDNSWFEANVRLFGPTLKGTALSMVTIPIAMTDAWLKRTLTRSGALQAIKTKWRRRLVQKTTSIEE